MRPADLMRPAPPEMAWPSAGDDCVSMPDFIAAEGGAAGLSAVEERTLCVVVARSSSGAGLFCGSDDYLAAKARCTPGQARAALSALVAAGYVKRAATPGGEAAWAADGEAMERLRIRHARYWDAKERLASMSRAARAAAWLARGRGRPDGGIDAVADAAEGLLRGPEPEAEAMESAADALEGRIAELFDAAGLASSSPADLARAFEAAAAARGEPPDTRAPAKAWAPSATPPRPARDGGGQERNRIPTAEEFDALGVPGAREALVEMLDDNPNPNRVAFAPRAYLELIREGADPQEVLSAWKRRRVGAGRRPDGFQPQLAAWLAASESDPRGARAALAGARRRESARENAVRSAAAGELYAESEEFRQAFDAARDPAADPARRASAQAKARAMIDEKAGENAEGRRPSDGPREKR